MSLTITGFLVKAAVGHEPVLFSITNSAMAKLYDLGNDGADAKRRSLPSSSTKLIVPK